MLNISRLYFLKYLVVIVLLISLSGCSVAMVASQDSYKNTNKLYKEMTVAELVSVMGPPTNIRDETLANGTPVKIYYYYIKRGSPAYSKALRIIMHCILDLATVFLWEFIGMPMEGAISQNYLKYDFTVADNKVIDFTMFSTSY